MDSSISAYPSDQGLPKSNFKRVFLELKFKQKLLFDPSCSNVYDQTFYLGELKSFIISLIAIHILTSVKLKLKPVFCAVLFWVIKCCNYTTRECYDF